MNEELSSMRTSVIGRSWSRITLRSKAELRSVHRAQVLFVKAVDEAYLARYEVLIRVEPMESCILVRRSLEIVLEELTEDVAQEILLPCSKVHLSSPRRR